MCAERCALGKAMVRELFFFFLFGPRGVGIGGGNGMAGRGREGGKEGDEGKGEGC